ncbi:hypothetical protein BC830DRAFT_529025 [Chytriomyces sp. MP71]|nr:hypothetical protein BC830DRAFT_529025 [Chytriomyces sp. MP71]
MPAAAKPPILASNVSTSKSSIDLGRLVINRTAEGSNAGTPIPSVAQAPSVSSKSFLERNIFANVMNPSASKIWEKCVKVYLLKPGEKFTSMIDISKARDGAGIRDAILDHPQFGLIGVSEEGRRNLALYAACDASGSYNEGWSSSYRQRPSCNIQVL